MRREEASNGPAAELYDHRVGGDSTKECVSNEPHRRLLSTCSLLFSFLFFLFSFPYRSPIRAWGAVG